MAAAAVGRRGRWSRHPDAPRRPARGTPWYRVRRPARRGIPGNPARRLTPRQDPGCARLVCPPGRGAALLQHAEGHHRRIRRPGPCGQQRDRLPVAMQRADIHIGLAGRAACAAPPVAIQALTSVPIYSSPRSGRATARAARAAAAGQLEGAPDPADSRHRALHLDLAHAPAASVTTASNSSGRSTGKSRNEKPVVRQARQRRLGEPDRVGQPDRTGSSAGISGAARKIASHSPAGSGWTT